MGRKISIITVGVFGTLGALATALVPSLVLMMIARCFLGIGVGLSTVACPTYVSENAPDGKKGFLGTFFQLAITFGIFLSYLVGLPFEHVEHNFRWMFGIGIFPGFALLILGFLMPESAYWISTKIKASEYDPLLSVKQPQIQEGGMIDLLYLPTRRSLFVGELLAVAQQLTGINAFMYYAPDIFKAAGVSSPVAATIAIGFWNFITTFVSTFLVDRLGRRPLLLFGTLLMAISALLLAATYQFLSGLALSILSIGFLFVFIAGFEMGEGPLFWVVCTELFEPRVRGAALSTLNASTWAFNLLLTFAFPILSKKIHESGVFWIFGGVGTVCVILMWFYLPETRQHKVVIVHD